MKSLEIHGQTGTSKILIGESLRNLPHFVSPARAIFITDLNVRGFHPAVFSGHETIELNTGEEVKSLETVEFIYQKLLDLEADRSTFLVGVGGGVVCDLAGFAASTYLRGLGFGYVATTLLAQVDASVGGKTGVNFKGYKNMVGVFNQPRFVICDPVFLMTLPQPQILSGLAEIVKHAAIGSLSLFEKLERRHGEILELRRDLLEEIIYESVAVKVAIVGRDEKETGERRTLNFGHTLGHALESTLGVSHGEAVSLGMVIAAELSALKGLLPEKEVRRLRALLQVIGLPVEVTFDKAGIIDAVRKDKKKAGSAIKMVLLRGIGEPVVTDLRLEELEAFIVDLR